NQSTVSLGASIVVGANSLTVTALGRYINAGDNRTHTLQIRDASTNTVLPGASVTINASGAPAGQFLYANLASSLVLWAGQSYVILSSEVSGGDTWHDFDNTAVATTADAALTNAVYTDPNTGILIFTGSANHPYIPVNFKYSLDV